VLVAKSLMAYELFDDAAASALHRRTSSTSVSFVRKELPANTLSEFTGYAKAKGRDLKMGQSLTSNDLRCGSPYPISGLGQEHACLLSRRHDGSTPRT
jgi:hypothetical protein